MESPATWRSPWQGRAGEPHTQIDTYDIYVSVYIYIYMIRNVFMYIYIWMVNYGFAMVRMVHTHNDIIDVYIYIYIHICMISWHLQATLLYMSYQ